MIDTAAARCGFTKFNFFENSVSSFPYTNVVCAIDAYKLCMQ
jgi:hypothetical protein